MTGEKKIDPKFDRQKRYRDKATREIGPEVRGIRRPKKLHAAVKASIDEKFPLKSLQK